MDIHTALVSALSAASLSKGAVAYLSPWRRSARLSASTSREAGRSKKRGPMSSGTTVTSCHELSKISSSLLWPASLLDTACRPDQPASSPLPAAEQPPCFQFFCFQQKGRLSHLLNYSIQRTDLLWLRSPLVFRRAQRKNAKRRRKPDSARRFSYFVMGCQPLALLQCPPAPFSTRPLQADIIPTALRCQEQQAQPPALVKFCHCPCCGLKCKSPCSQGQATHQA